MVGFIPEMKEGSSSELIAVMTCTVTVGRLQNIIDNDSKKKNIHDNPIIRNE